MDAGASGAFQAVAEADEPELARQLMGIVVGTASSTEEVRLLHDGVVLARHKRNGLDAGRSV
jgi:hypothetical protein